MNDIQIDIAQEKLSDWLEEQEDMGGNPPADMEFLLGMKEEEIEDRIFFAFKYKKSPGGKWLIGVAGGFEDEDDLECPLAFAGDFECPDDLDDAASVALYLAIFTLQMQKAKDMLCDWLSKREEMDGEEPEEIEYRFVIRGERSNNRIFFVFGFKKPDDDNWYIGIAGGYKDEESLDCSTVFSGFNEFPEDHDEALGLAFAMANFILKYVSQTHNRIESAVKQNLDYVRTPGLDAEKIANQFVMTQSRFFLTIGVVDVPSGRVIVSDPLCYLSGNNEIAPVLEKEIPKGIYRVEVSLYRDQNIGIRICSARLKIKETAAVRYELAKPTAETAFMNDEEGVTCGFPVEAGLISFIDADGAEVYRKVDKEWWAEHPGGNRYDDYFKALFAESYERLPDYQREGGDFIQWINPENGERMVMAASGLGDGFYLCFWGYDEDDEICELIVPMVDPDLFEDPNDENYDEDEDEDEDDDDGGYDIDKLLKEAYQANPKCYEKEDGTLLVDFALTEDTDSLFPIAPEEQWGIEGKTISEWIITMVSLTKPQGGIIGQMENHEAIKRLEPFIIFKQDNWALIRAMTHDELDGLFGDLPRNLNG